MLLLGVFFSSEITCNPPILAPIEHGRSSIENRSYTVGEVRVILCLYRHWGDKTSYLKNLNVQGNMATLTL